MNDANGGEIRPAAISVEPVVSVSEPEVHEKTVQNDDGSTTTITTSIITETTTTPLDPVVTTIPVNEDDSDYHTITDDEGTELESYEKTTTTAESEISTETVTTMTVTTEMSQMTNVVETENATVENVSDESVVAPADSKVEAAAKEFLGDQNVASDFAIYADKVDESIGHVDGNVAVNTMATGGQIDIMNKDDSQYGAGNADQYAENGYSYIGSTENGTTIKTTSNQIKDGEVSSKIVVGENVEVTDNAHGSAGHFQMDTAETKADGGVTSESASMLATSDSRLADIENTTDINNNLNKIADSGQKLIDATKDEDSTADDDLNKVLAAIGALVQKQNTTSEDGISILNVTIHSKLLTDSKYTNDLNNKKIFQDLVKKNTSNTKVIVSIDCSDTDENTGITAYFNPSNDINNYDNKAANLYWNFGSYGGKITFESQWVGNIIAANATVHANAGVQSGRIVAKTAGHKSGEIHMAVSGNVVTKKVTSEPVVTRSDKKTIIVSSEPSVSYKYQLKNQPSKPDVPSNPDIPITPDTPDVPENPSNSENPGTTENHYSSSETENNQTTIDNSGNEQNQNESNGDESEHIDEALTHGGNVRLINDNEADNGLPQIVLGKIRAQSTDGNSSYTDTQITKGNIRRKNVQTGDESNMFLWGSLAAASLCALGVAVAIKKKK